MIALKKKKIVRNLIFVFLFIILLLLIIVIVIAVKYYTNEDVMRLHNINSDKDLQTLIVPYNINQIYSQYNGNLSLLTIQKSIYNFAHDVVPHYKNVVSKQYQKELEVYYNDNKFAIGVDTGINNYDEFESLMEGIALLEGNISIQTYELSNVSPSKTSNYLVTRLFVKYNGNPRIIFKIKISNEKLKNISSIKYSFNNMEK